MVPKSTALCNSGSLGVPSALKVSRVLISSKSERRAGITPGTGKISFAATDCTVFNLLIVSRLVVAPLSAVLTIVNDPSTILTYLATTSISPTKLSLTFLAVSKMSLAGQRFGSVGFPVSNPSIPRLVANSKSWSVALFWRSATLVFIL